MCTITKIACRTAGALGIGVALFDAGSAAKHFSKVQGELSKANQLEKAYFSSRTTDTYSPYASAIQKKTFDLRTKNPLPSLWGRTKGGVSGALNSLGDHLFTVACSACAILSKGMLAKVGAVGVGLKLCYDIARNGFGLGKNNPMH